MTRRKLLTRLPSWLLDPFLCWLRRFIDRLADLDEELSSILYRRRNPNPKPTSPIVAAHLAQYLNAPRFEDGRIHGHVVANHDCKFIEREEPCTEETS